MKNTTVSDSNAEGNACISDACDDNDNDDDDDDDEALDMDEYEESGLLDAEDEVSWWLIKWYWIFLWFQSYDIRICTPVRVEKLFQILRKVNASFVRSYSEL